MKKILILIIAFSGNFLYAKQPTVGILKLKSNSLRGFNLVEIMDRQLGNILRTYGQFDIIKSQDLRSRLISQKCEDEACILDFAQRAGITILVRGELDDRGNYVYLHLVAQGAYSSIGGKVLVDYFVKISMPSSISRRREIYLIEEQIGEFASKILKSYGKEIGSKYLVQGADSIGKFYFGRKKEIIFPQSSIEPTLFSVLLTIPASTTMPLAAPFMGYYKNGDWSGLGLWAVNYAPYLYLQLDGYSNDPDAMKSSLGDIDSNKILNRRFYYYFTAVGGLSLFIDAFSHGYLGKGAMYDGKQELMGNSYTAAYFSLITGGGGMFYKGHRLWGYTYFHLNNIMVYEIIKALSPTERYDVATCHYVKDSINKRRAYSLIGGYLFLKLFELGHSLMIDENIKGGEEVNLGFKIFPVVDYDNYGVVNYGLSVGYNF